MVRLSQRDRLWSFKTIGSSKSTIGNYGCTITSLSMLSDYFGCFKDPGWIAKYMKFQGDLILWKYIDEFFCFKFVYRYYSYRKEIIDEALKNPDKALILQVYNRHWVVPTRKVPFGYIVADPWTGSNKFYSEKSVSGFSLFKK